MCTMPNKPNEKKPEIDITNPRRTDTRDAEMGKDRAPGHPGKPTDGQRGSGNSATSSDDAPTNPPGSPRNIDQNKPSGLPVPPQPSGDGINAAVGDGVAQADARNVPVD